MIFLTTASGIQNFSGGRVNSCR